MMRWTPAYNNLREPPPPSGVSLIATYQNLTSDNFLDHDTKRAREAAAEVGLNWKQIPHFGDYIPYICGTLNHEEEVTVTVHQMLGKYKEHPLLDEQITRQTESLIILEAYFHDRGKLCLDQKKLYQPSHNLSAEDIEHIRLHPVYSEDLLRGKDVAFFNQKLESLNKEHGWSYPLLPTDDPTIVPAIAKAVRHHHENIDGTGYPDGLVGKDIPLSSRIIAAADRHHAQTQERCYKPGMSVVAALKVVRDRAPQLVEAVHVSALILSKAPPQQQYIFFSQHRRAMVTPEEVLRYDWWTQPPPTATPTGRHHLRPMGIGLYAATTRQAPAPLEP
ncbi:MAG: HD domain-containing protein [Alphaproteobacteria bacterium]|nr:HD domain-containing protein [Alphaproteobacteria bacterium]